MSIRILLSAAALGFAATSASAQTELYLGFGADYAVPHSGDDQAFGSFIAGATFELWENLGLGIEGELGEPIGDSSDDRETSRVRGLFTYDLGYATAIASLGKVQYEIGSETFNGDTVGLGAQMEIMDRLDGRIELIRDFNEDEYGSNVTTTRFALLYKF